MSPRGEVSGTREVKAYEMASFGEPSRRDIGEVSGTQAFKAYKMASFGDAAKGWVPSVTAGAAPRSA
jgi:hypothetical protein